jgi:hypothetical protein
MTNKLKAVAIIVAAIAFITYLFTPPTEAQRSEFARNAELQKGTMGFRDDYAP